MAKDPYADDIARLSTATRTHFTHFTAPAMPWHDENHKFGESSDGQVDDSGEGDVREDRPNGDTPIEPIGDPGVDKDIDESIRAARASVLGPTVTLVSQGRCYYDRQPAAYGSGGKLYCIECWSAVKEDEEDPYR